MKKWLCLLLTIVNGSLFAHGGLHNHAFFQSRKDITHSLFSSVIFSPIFFTEITAAGDYRSKQSGDWSLSSTWEIFDGSAWVNASTVPSSSDGNITIQSTHTVTISNTVTADQVIIDAGGILTVNSTLALADGTGDDLTVNGTLNVAAGAITNSAGGTPTVTNNGAINWSGGSWTTVGTVTNAAAGIFTISGTASQMSDGIFENSGIINWSNGNLVLSNYTLNNYSTASFNITGNNSMSAGICGGSPCSVTFNNYGTIYKSSTGITDLLVSNNYGTIKGVGTLNCNNLVSKGTTISPGYGGIGILTVNGGNVFNNFSSSPTFTSASNFLVEIKDGTGPGTGHDQLKRTGNLTLAGSLTVSEIGTVPSGSYVIISVTSGTISGFFQSFQLPPGYLYSSTSTSVTLQKGTCSNPITNNTITAPAVTSFCGSGDPDLITGSIAAGGAGVMTYQWQKQVGTDIYRDIPGATSSDYNPPAISQTTNYRRIASTGSCSSYSSVVTITITGSSNTPTITALSATTFCSGGNVTLSSSSTSGNQWYKDGVIISGATSQTYSATTTGVYTCTVAGSGCTSNPSNSISVTVVSPTSSPTITALSATTFCSGGSVTLSSSSSSGNQWYKDGVIISGATSQTYSATSTGVYTCTVTSSGCTSGSSNGITVTVNAVPASPTITALSATTFCSGGSVTLSSSSAGGNQWYKDGVIISSATSQTYNAIASGVYTCTVTSSGCTSNASNGITVTVNAVPSSPTITALSATTFCSGGSVTLSSSSAIGNQWYKDGVIISGATNQTYNAIASGVYTCTATGSGCTSNASNAITVTVNAVPASPSITALSATTFCSGGSVTLSSSSASANQWYKDGVIISGATSQTYSATTTGVYTCTVAGSGCTSNPSNSISVTVVSPSSSPTITALSATTFCSGGSVTLSSSSASGNQWYKDGAIISGATSQTYSANSSGVYTCTVMSSGCTSNPSNGITVTVNPVPASPTITALSATTFCSGGSVTLSSSSASGNQWYKDGVIISSATNQTYSATSSGIYTCTVTNSGCTSGSSNGITVTVNPVPSSPTITALSGTTFCSGGSVTLSSSSASGNQWYKDGVIISGATNQTYSATSSGVYTCTVTSSGCTSNASNGITVTVNAVPASPSITALSATTFCSGGSVTLSSSSASGNQWYKNGAIISGATNQTYNAIASGVYTCTVTSSGCTSGSSNGITVTVNAVPASPTITALSATTFCSGGSVTLSSSSASSNQWYKDGVIISGATSQTYSATSIGVYTCTVTSSGCTSNPSNGISVTVVSPTSSPTITALSATTFCSGGSVTLSSSSASGNQWYKDGIIISGATSQTYSATSTGVYTCTVTSSGCTSAPSNTITVTVNAVPASPTITALSATTFCSGGSVTLSSSSASGNQWYKDGVIISGATSQTYSATTTGVYTCTVAGSGCTSNPSNSISVTVVSPTSSPTITALSATTFCSGGSVTLSSSSASGNQWYKDGAIISGATSQTYSANSSGVYTCTVTSSGCTSNASNGITVTVNAVPASPTITALSGTTFCSGGSVTLSSSSASGNQWYKDGVIISSATNQTYSATTTGVYTCTVMGSGCTSAPSNAITVTVNAVPASPTITALSATTFCSGGSVTLSSSSASGNQWYKDGVIISSATNQTYNAIASGVYTCTVTSSGCTSNPSNSIGVTVVSPTSSPTITALSATTFCSGGSVTLSSSSASSNQWYKDGVIISGATSQTYSATSSGVYTCTVTSSGCTSAPSNGISVTVNNSIPAPVIKANGTTTFCTTGTVVFNSSSASGNQWYFNGNIIPGATNQTYTAAQAGTYTAVVTDGICISPSSNGIDVLFNTNPPAPVISAQGVTTFCNGGSAKLLSSSASGNQWYYNGNKIAGATAQTYNATVSGTYTATVNIDGCVSGISNLIQITVLAGPPKPDITLVGNSLQSSSTSGNQWYKDGGIINGATAQVYTPSANGNYVVVVTINGCSSPASDIFTYLTTSIPGVNTVSGIINVYPNPVVEKLIIRTKSTAINQLIRLYDINGKQLLEYKNTLPVMQINMSRFASGLYLLWIDDRKNKIKGWLKIVKQQ